LVVKKFDVCMVLPGDAPDPLLTVTASPKAITSSVALGSVAGIDEKMSRLLLNGGRSQVAE
jgi:hypothetical protein